MNRTAIEWVRNPDNRTQGWTWNPVTGCLNHVNGYCRGGGFPCYACRIAQGRLKNRYSANRNVSLKMCDASWPIWDDPFWPRFWENRLDEPWRKTEPSGIFAVDMGELFGDWIPDEWIRQVLDVIKMNTRHRFYLLTKQPQNLRRWSPFPPNCWVGVTVVDSRSDVGSFLRYVDAPVRFISFEPLLHWPLYGCERVERSLRRIGVDWVIIGAQTNPLRRPDPRAVKEITEAALSVGMEVFHKDNLKETGNLGGRLDDTLFMKVHGVGFRQGMPMPS